MLRQVRWSEKLSILWLVLLSLGALLAHLGLFDSLEQVNVHSQFGFPSQDHWLGTDSLGRDLLVRILLGGGTSLWIALQSIFVSLVLAAFYGGSAGWVGRWWDVILMSLLDVWMSLPSAVLAAIFSLLLTRLSDSLVVVSAVIGLTHWGRLARIIRTEVLRLKDRDYVKVASSFGGTGLYIIRKHILPQVFTVVSIYLVYQLPSLILAESFLSFIGLGVQSPATSWGILLQEGWRSLQVYPQVVFFPAVFLFLTVLSLHFIFLHHKESREENQIWW